MKIECKIEKIKHGISKMDRIAGKNLTLPILDSFLLIVKGSTLKIRATNLSIGVEVEIPVKVLEEGVVAIRGDIFSQTISSMNDNDVLILEALGENLKLKTKNSSITIKSFPSEDFPTIPSVSGTSFSVSSSKLLDGIKSVYYSGAISDIKPEISSTYVYGDGDSLIFVATDSFRLAEKKIKTKNIEEFPGIIIPFKNISEIIKILADESADVIVTISKNQMSLSLDGVYLTSRIVDGVFPDYKQIIPKEFKTEIVVLKQDLINALKVSNVFSDKFNQITLLVKPKEKTMAIFSKNSEIGENTTNITASLSGENAEVSFNHKYLTDCLQSINQDSISIQLNQNTKPMIIKGISDQSFSYLIMPMNK